MVAHMLYCSGFFIQCHVSLVHIMVNRILLFRGTKCMSNESEYTHRPYSQKFTVYQRSQSHATELPHLGYPAVLQSMTNVPSFGQSFHVTLTNTPLPVWEALNTALTAWYSCNSKTNTPMFTNEGLIHDQPFGIPVLQNCSIKVYT